MLFDVLEDYVLARARDEKLVVPAWYHALGLAAEAGEVADEVKKAARRREHYYCRLDGVQDIDIGSRRSAIVSELGDVMFYFIRFCASTGIEPEEVFDGLWTKLESMEPKV